MLTNLALGTLFISITVLIHTFGLVVLTRTMNGVVHWFRLHRHDFGKSVAMVTTVLGLSCSTRLRSGPGPACSWRARRSSRFRTRCIIPSVTFSTVGSGDIVVGPRWRLLASLEGINGFILIGWSTAYLVSASTRHGPFRLGEHF